MSRHSADHPGAWSVDVPAPSGGRRRRSADAPEASGPVPHPRQPPTGPSVPGTDSPTVPVRAAVPRRPPAAPRPGRPRRSRRLVVLLTVAVVAIVAGVAGVWLLPGTGDRAGTTTGDPAIAASIAGLPQRSVGVPPTMRLAEGQVPPTNRWFSGLVFPDEPQPVFPLPLSVAVRTDGLSLGLPEVRADDATIFGSHTPALDVPLGTSDLRVVAYDDLTVTVAMLAAGGAETGRLVITRGSPFVHYTATTAQDLTVGPQPLDADGTVVIRDGRYGVVTDGELTGSALSLPAGGSATFYAVPPDGDPAVFADAARVAVTGGSVTEDVAGDTVRSTLTYRTEGGDTIAGPMPGADAGCDPVGRFATVYGPMPVCHTSALTVGDPVLAPSGALDLSGVDDAGRAELATLVERDVAELTLDAADTYFGGKQLVRAATLMRLASDLGLEPTAQRVRDQLVPLLERWADPAGCAGRSTHCFVYDPVVRGMVGLESSFGSEEFNDHQFHYGYFLYAAALLGRDDPALVERIGPVVDLLAADVGSPVRTPEFPEYRAFDAFAGHSWASGFSPFGDGNNQESSSESVSAYNGLALWSELRGDTVQQDRAVAMLSREAASAMRHWVEPDLAAFPEFAHGVVGINWGGKRDHATWFSAEPSAILAIQLIPMSPVAEYLRGDPERIRENVAAATPTGYDVPYADSILMYLALADPDAAATAARALPDERIDDGNSRSYLTAWILAQR
ncbi:glycosyl hydrolase [Pseudonocardia kongjuensis]|uniref:glycosyl hydrolase n=1 Tax=Pseudonocardia kongjuensis TaxID=102227 RepID=UPI0031D645FF